MSYQCVVVVVQRLELVERLFGGCQELLVATIANEVIEEDRAGYGCGADAEEDDKQQGSKDCLHCDRRFRL